MAETAAQNEQLRRYVENHHIDMIPAAARHGKVWHQFAFWWGGNVNVFNVFLGSLVIFLGLDFVWALVAIAIGTMIGAALIALHATQGPKLGVPQTIQSRAQFGFYGSAFMFPAVLLLNVGFIAAQLVIQAQSMQGVIASVSIPVWIVILAVPAVIIGIFGYRWIHRVMQATAVVVGVSLIIMLIQGLRFGSLPASQISEENLAHVRALSEIASSRGQSMAQLALSWVLRDERVTSAVIGASSVAQLEDNLGAAGHTSFSSDELAAIDSHAVQIAD